MAGGPDPGGRPRRGGLALAALSVVCAFALAALLTRERWWPYDPAPVAARVRCTVSWRPGPEQAPQLAGELTVVTRDPPVGENVQRLAAGPLTFEASTPNLDPGFRNGPGSDGSDLHLSVADGRGRVLASQLFQIWSGPTDDFAGNTGFTGLVYVNDPETGTEVQYACIAER